MSAKITTNRYPEDNTISVYRDNHHCGMVFCPTEAGRLDFLASPWTEAVVQRAFPTDAEAIDYLIRAA